MIRRLRNESLTTAISVVSGYQFTGNLGSLSPVIIPPEVLSEAGIQQ